MSDSKRRTADRGKARARSRRPLTDEEIPHAEALGALIRSLRVKAGYSSVALAWLSDFSKQGLYNIEVATRRTRASTLARIARPLSLDSDMTPDELTARLIEVAGIALAPEAKPEHQARIEKRRAARVKKNNRRMEQHARYFEAARDFHEHGPLPLRGPDSRWLPRQPTEEQLEKIRARYHRLQLAMPPLDENGRFIEGDPMLDHSTAWYYFNPPKRYVRNDSCIANGSQTAVLA